MGPGFCLVCCGAGVVAEQDKGTLAMGVAGGVGRFETLLGGFGFVAGRSYIELGG